MGAACDAELQAVETEARKISDLAAAARVDILIPDEKELKKLAEELKAFSGEQLRDAMKSRSGEAYEVLRERGEIVKRNNSNRFEIAKLSIAAAAIPEDGRKALADAIRSGRVDEALEPGVDEKTAADIAKFMRRCGIRCSPSGTAIECGEENGGLEVCLEICNKPVWINGNMKGKLEGTLQKIAELNPRIQLKNAERQIKRFNDEEERDFVSLQRNYLELIKERDELLRDFSEEEKRSVRVD